MARNLVQLLASKHSISPGTVASVLTRLGVHGGDVQHHKSRETRTGLHTAWKSTFCSPRPISCGVTSNRLLFARRRLKDEDCNIEVWCKA